MNRETFNQAVIIDEKIKEIERIIGKFGESGIEGVEAKVAIQVTVPYENGDKTVTISFDKLNEVARLEVLNLRNKLNELRTQLDQDFNSLQ